MRFQILVCNQQSLGNIDGDALVASITRSNFYTLCDQYGLSHEQIAPGELKLEVLAVRRSVAPFFVLHYKPSRKDPIFVNEWNLSDPAKRKWFESLPQKTPSHEVEKHLQRTRFIVSIALDSTQLVDLGRLLAYELARWAAEMGRGLVWGLDGKWYRLNIHQAFIQI